eukprot:3959771-Amphidinium_carterae.2
MRNLQETRSNGIVLLTGGTGTGKSSVIPPALYLDTIAKADQEKRQEKRERFTRGELRPGGKILITQPRKALARSMASYLRNMNTKHDYLFGFQHAGHATSSQHAEPVLYMTDGIAVLMSWVTDVMDLVNKAREPLNRRGGVLDLSVVTEASKVPWNLEHQVLVVDECHLRSVNCDVIIALTRWLQSVGVPLVLLLMSPTANEEEFVEKLGVDPDMIVNIYATIFNVDRYVMRCCPADLLEKDVAMPNMVAAIQAIIQILLHDKMWGEDDPVYKTEYWKDPRLGKDILVFLPGTAEISIMATTLECLVKGGYITAVKVYKINARVDQKTLNEMNETPNGRNSNWPHETYASRQTWDRVHDHNKRMTPRTIRQDESCCPAEAVNAGITLPQVEWVITTMGVRRVYYDPRRGISVNVLAAQTKSSAIQEGGRSGRTFPGKHLLLTSRDEMDNQLQVDELPGVKVQKLDEPAEEPCGRIALDGTYGPRDLEVVYRLITTHLVTPSLAYLPPGVLSTSLELEPEMGIFLWNMILGGMPMEGLVWSTLVGRNLLQDVMHPDAMNYYLHPEGRAHALMFPLNLSPSTILDAKRNFRVNVDTTIQGWRWRLSGCLHDSDEADAGNVEHEHLQQIRVQHKGFQSETV